MCMITIYILLYRCLGNIQYFIGHHLFLIIHVHLGLRHLILRSDSLLASSYLSFHPNRENASRQRRSRHHLFEIDLDSIHPR